MTSFKGMRYRFCREPVDHSLFPQFLSICRGSSLRRLRNKIKYRSCCKEKAEQHSAILSYMSINLTNVYIDIKGKILGNITDKSCCKQFIFCFEVVQTIYFGVSSSANNFFFQISHPPSRKIMVRPLVSS